MLSGLLAASCSTIKPAQPAVVQPQSTPVVQLYFTRAGEDPALALVKLYNAATDNIDIAIYALTHPDIVRAIGDACKRGAKVRVITDSDQARSNIQKHAVNDLLTVGVPVKVNTDKGIMHIKMSIIDGKAAMLGSYNYTQSASRDNDEVLVVITQPETVQRCRSEFERMWCSPDFIAAQMSY